MTTVPEPGVIITLTSIYAKLVKVEKDLARVASDIRNVRSTQHEVDTDHETRLRGLEASRMPWKVIGGFVGVGALLATIVGMLIKQN
jgi:hypothetical protein